MAKRNEESRNRSSTELPVGRQETPSPGPSRRGFTSPFGLLQEMSNEMSRMLHNFPVARDFGGWEGEREAWVPQVDVLRRGENLVVRADLPGLSREDVSMDVTENALTIRGERRQEREEEREGYYWHERSEGSFYRTIPLPDGTDVDQANARFENGVLEVSLPAPREEGRRGRRIEIR